jgi:hypothetical protein
VAPGADTSFSVLGIVGRTNIITAVDWTAYFKADQVDKVSYSATAYYQTNSPAMISSATATGFGNVSANRFGLTLRPNPSPGSAHTGKFAFDLYNGDPNPIYFFQANKAYKVGDVVIPTDTKPDNSNNRKMFTVVAVTALSGAEPAWPSVLAIPSATVVSGGVTFQSTHDNGITGSWEPYNGAHGLPANLAFMSTLKTAFYISEAGYGCAINGVMLTKQTDPIPVHPTNRFTLEYNPDTLYLGHMGSNYSADPNSGSPYLPSDGSGALPRLTSFSKNLFVWNAVGDDESMAALTA